MNSTDREHIEGLLPHRDPFLFVDRLESATEQTIVGTRCFREDESFFRGHFPEYPVVPGVLLIEMMAQCGGAGVKEAGLVDRDGLFFLGTVEKAKFRRQVRPGDTVRIEITNDRISPRVIRQSGVVSVEGQKAAEATWMCLVGSE